MKFKHFDANYTCCKYLGSILMQIDYTLTNKWFIFLLKNIKNVVIIFLYAFLCKIRENFEKYKLFFS